MNEGGRTGTAQLREVVPWLRVLVGPAAMAAFFLPIARGPSLLSAYRFSGLDLVTLTGRLQTLDLDTGEEAGLWAFRIGLLCIPIAAAWQTLLAPYHRWHPGYAISGWFLVAVAAILLATESVNTGVGWPASGLLLLIAAAVTFAGSAVLGRWR